MRKVITLVLFAFLTFSLASCDWIPTDIDHRDDKKERDDRDDDRKERENWTVRGGEGDAFKTPCNFHFVVQTISVEGGTSDRAGDLRTTLVVINVVSSDGTTTSYTLTNENPSVTIGDCTIHLRGVERLTTRDTDTAVYLAVFSITSE